MKKFIGIILSIIILTFGLVLPVQAGALPATITDAGISTADRLVETQNNDGGWDWSNPDMDPTSASPFNTLGVTGQGVLDMYKLTGSPAYWTTCNNTYNAMVVNSSNSTPTVRKIRGPDIGFAVDMSEVTGDPTYANFAAARWEAAKTEFGGGTATGFAEYIRDLRVGQGWETLVAWDINLYVQSLIALGNYFPGSAYLTEAAEMGEVSYAFLYAGAFPLADESLDGYWLTFSGALESFTITATHADKAVELTDNLTSSQHPDGYFSNAGVADLQTTAYAAIALLKAGSYAPAYDAVNYLVSQLPTYIGGPDENTEVESEIAQAIYDLTLSTPLDIVATAGIGGTVTPSGIVAVAYGGGQLFTIAPDIGYHITDVLVDSVSIGDVSDYAFTDVVADHTLEVSFAINTYTLTRTSGVGGSIVVTPDQLTYDHGTSVQVLAAPASGYQFAGWSGNLTGNTNPGTIMMDGNKSVTATFSVIAGGGGDGGGGGGGGGSGSYTDTDILGSQDSLHLNYKGETTKEFTASNDEITINIPKGTKMQDSKGKPLNKISINPDPTPALPPEGKNIIGLAYDFSPNGAQFDPPLNLTFNYDEGNLPEGVTEENLVLAFYDEATGQWVELPCVVDTVNNKITASVSHYTTFAIVGTLNPAAFTLSLLVVTPSEVVQGEKINISITVTNSGAMEGSYTVVLNVNGVKKSEAKATVAAGNSEIITFTATEKEPGRYIVEIGGLSGSFTVVAPPPTTTPPTTTPPTTTPPATTPPATTPPDTTQPVTPTPMAAYWWYIIGAAVVIVIGTIIVFVVRRRHD